MKVLNFFKNILVFLLIIVSFVFINIYMALFATRKLVAKDNIVNIVKDIDIVDIIGEDAEKEIYAVLDEVGIPKDYATYVLESEEVKETVGEFIAETFDYVLGYKEIPTMDEQKLADVLKNSFDTIVNESEKYDIPVNEYISEEEQKMVHEQIDLYVSEIVQQLPEVEDFINTQIEDNKELQEAQEEMQEVKDMIEKVQNVYQKKELFLLGVFIPLILVVLLKLKELKFIGWLAFASIFYGVPFILISIALPQIWNIVYTEDLAIVKSIIEPSINLISSIYLESGILLLVLGIVLIVVKVSLKAKNKKDKELVSEEKGESV